LLLAILYQAFEDVTTDEDWRDLWNAPSLPKDKIEAYLNRQDGMDLFGEKPFMQIPKLEMKAFVPLSALATEAAVGNNATLFDHRSDVAPQAYTPSEAARMLIASQSFALGFGRAAEARVDGKAWPRPYLADAIALRGVCIFLTGGSLKETLLLNMPLRSNPNKKDVPAWELPDPTTTLDTLSKDGKRISQPENGPVERYAWLSRMIRLLPDDDGLVRRMYFTQGREADKTPGDMMKAFVQSKKEGMFPLSLSASKASWRDLHALLETEGKQKPAILHHVAHQVVEECLDSKALYGLNIVGLATDPGKAGKFLLWRHDRVALPPALLAENDDARTLRKYVELAIGEAEEIAGILGQRIYLVARRFLPPLDNPDPNDVRSLTSSIDPRVAYWARLETHFAVFLEGLRDINSCEEALRVWQHGVEAEAERALRESCRQLGESGRAMRATAAIAYRFIADSNERARLAAEKPKRQAAKGASK